MLAVLLIPPPGAAIAQEAPPLPRPNPVRLEAEPAADFAEAAAELFGTPLVGEGGITAPSYLIAAAYDRLRADNVDAALQIARAIPDTAGLALVEWLIAIDGYSSASAERMAEAAQALPAWPARILMRIRYEQAVRRAEPTPEAAIAALEGEPPRLEPTILLLARSYRSLDHDADAAALIRDVWRDRSFSTELEEIILAEFGEVLTIDDHRWRMSRLFYDGETDAALRTADLLSADMQALAVAWAAVNRGNSNASALLAAVPATLHSDPGYLYARLRQFVRAGAYSEAARLLLEAPTDPVALIDPEAWSRQSRDVARVMIQNGNAEAAYAILAGQAAVDRNEIAEVAFLAGWTALRFLDDPERAIPHFEALAASSSLPLSQSRAHYWLGRCYDALGNSVEAETQYALAGGYHLTFYGQLAIERLGGEQIPLAPEPVIDDTAIAAFLAEDRVQAMVWLDGLGRRAEADILARHLGETLDDPIEIALLAELAEARGDYQLALQIGKLAANRGLAVDGVAFSLAALPPGFTTDHVDPALIFAVARQESAFDNTATSSAGARGLLQILPSTAREMAAYVGIAFHEARLAEPEYNALLGGAYLGTLLDRYDGSVVLALAAFNAGFTRADRWIEIYGDPRSGTVDPIDWIERIPFDETRNYVQRVMENLQVYRARLGAPELTLADDLGL